jgi:hypothetical protein
MNAGMRDQINRLVEKAVEKARDALHPSHDAPEWRDSPHVCALADSERHLGHAVRVSEYWVAYDAIHFNPAEDGFRVIGTFPTIEEAKAAIVNSVSLSWLRATGGTVVDSKTRLDLRKI